MKYLVTFLFIPFWSLAYCQYQQQIERSVILNGHNAMIGNYYSNRDILWGAVKRVIEIRYLKFFAGSYKKNKSFPIDTLNFTKAGNIDTYNLPIDFLTNNSYNSRFFDKYDLSKKQKAGDPIDTSDQIVPTFDAIGHRNEVNIYSKNKERWKLQAFTFKRMEDLLEGFVSYKSNDSINVRESYKYSKSNLLRRVIDFFPDGQVEELVFITYKAFDRKGNWTKRTETRKTPSGKTTGIVITERKITYFK